MKKERAPKQKTAELPLAADSCIRLANLRKENEEKGFLLVHEAALATIVKKTVLGVKGVSRLNGSSFLNDIAEMFRSKKIQDRAIDFTVADGRISLEISLFFYMGYRIPELALQIKEQVAERILKATGLVIDQVNVKVRGLEEEPVPQEENKEEEN